MRNNRIRSGRDGRTPAGQYAAYQAAQEFAASQQGRPYTFGGQQQQYPGGYGQETSPQPIVRPAAGPAYRVRYHEPEPEPARGKGAPAPATGATIRLTLCVAVLAAVAVIVPSSRLAIAVFLAVVAIWALWSRQHWYKQQRQEGDDWAALAERAGYGPRR